MLDYTLPTDIVDVQVERGGTSAQPELDIEVRRRTPLVAYCIVAVAIAAASTYDISMQLLVRASFCRNCVPLLSQALQRFAAVRLLAASALSFTRKASSSQGHIFKHVDALASNKLARDCPACRSDTDMMLASLQQPGGNSLKRAWRGMSALACCVPWVAVSLLRRPDETMKALRDPMLCLSALLSGAQHAPSLPPGFPSCCRV